MSSDLGFGEIDFTNIVNDIGVSVSWEAVTKTEDNVQGDETLDYATAVNKSVVFVKQNEQSQQVKAGILNSGDALVMADVDYGFAKNDRITYNGFIYIIKNDPIRREIKEIQLFDTCYLREIGPA